MKYDKPTVWECIAAGKGIVSPWTIAIGGAIGWFIAKGINIAIGQSFAPDGLAGLAFNMLFTICMLVFLYYLLLYIFGRSNLRWMNGK